MTQAQVSQSDPPPGFIDLGIGHPSYSLLPMEMLHQASEKYFATKDPHPLQYGLEQGNSNFRQGLARFLISAYGRGSVDPSLLFVTTGASSAIDLICSVFTSPGDVIFVEEPSYFLALRIFRDHGLRVVPVAVDDSGLCLDGLEVKIEESHPKLIYIIPTFQNPSGVTLSEERREKLVELAERYDVLIMADEVYHLLAYNQTPPRSFATLIEHAEHVISVNSFSKILAPGLRLGWVHANREIIQRLISSSLLDSGGGMNPFTSAVVHGLIESGGLEQNIANLRREYTLRLSAMDAALEQHLPAARWLPPHGGFFFWVNLPGVDAAHLQSKSQHFHAFFRHIA